MSLSTRMLQAYGVDSLAAACEAAVAEHLPMSRQMQAGDPITPLAESVGIRVQVRDVDAFDGCLSWTDSGDCVVTVSSTGSMARQRFTLAHELGHWILQQSLGQHRSGPLFRGLSSTQSAVKDEEALANLVGAEILMPARHVRALIDEHGICLRTVSRMSKQFFASRIAALRRVADVCCKHLLYINVVPKDFRDLASVAEIDDAVYVRPGQGTLLARDSTRFAESRSYYEVSSSRPFHGAFMGVDGQVHAVFDTRAYMNPIPNTDLLAVSDKVPNSGAQ